MEQKGCAEEKGIQQKRIVNTMSTKSHEHTAGRLYSNVAPPTWALKYITKRTDWSLDARQKNGWLDWLCHCSWDHENTPQSMLMNPTQLSKYLRTAVFNCCRSESRVRMVSPAWLRVWSRSACRAAWPVSAWVNFSSTTLSCASTSSLSCIPPPNHFHSISFACK